MRYPHVEWSALLLFLHLSPSLSHSLSGVQITFKLKIIVCARTQQRRLPPPLAFSKNINFCGCCSKLRLLLLRLRLRLLLPPAPPTTGRGCLWLKATSSFELHFQFEALETTTRQLGKVYEVEVACQVNELMCAKWREKLSNFSICIHINVGPRHLFLCIH